MRKIFAVSTRNSAETSAQPENWRSILQLFGSSDMKNDLFFLVSSPLGPAPFPPALSLCQNMKQSSGGDSGTRWVWSWFVIQQNMMILQGPESLFAYFVKPLQGKGELLSKSTYKPCFQCSWWSRHSSLNQRKGPGYHSRRGEFISAILKQVVQHNAWCHTRSFISRPCLPKKLFQNGRNDFASSRVVTWKRSLAIIPMQPLEGIYSWPDTLGDVNLQLINRLETAVEAGAAKLWLIDIDAHSSRESSSGSLCM